MTAFRLVEDHFANVRPFPLWLAYVAAREAGARNARRCWEAWRRAGGRP